LSSFPVLPKDEKRTTASSFTLRLLPAVAISLLLFPALARARGGLQEPHQPLGSLSSVGEVYVNNSPAPADSTIFTDDTIRTGATGTATFTSGAKGSFQISPQSQLVFNGGDQYVAELQMGMVVMSSLRGSQGLSLRTGVFSVAAMAEWEQSTSKIEKAPDGSFTITCLDGSMILVPTNGSNGLLIQTGQTVTISSQGKLSAVKETAPAPAQTPAASQSSTSTTKWVILGVVSAGAAAAAAAAALAGHKSSSVSPATP
jgi:hypothetical protein